MATIKAIIKGLIAVFAIIGVVLSTVYLNSFARVIYQSTGKRDIELTDILDDKSIATTENPVLSPSKKYWLQIVKGYDGEVHFNQFYIVKALENGKRAKEIEYFCSETFRTRDRIFFLWDSEDRVWVYSGDVGTSYWEKGKESIWVKHSEGDQGIKAPEKLRLLIN